MTPGLPTLAHKEWSELFLETVVSHFSGSALRLLRQARLLMASSVGIFLPGSRQGLGKLPFSDIDALQASQVENLDAAWKTETDP